MEIINNYKLVDDYKLGIMWSTGTLAKGTDRFVLQTSNKEKLYFLEKLSEINQSEIVKKERIVRGQKQPLWMVRFSDGLYSARLRELGYDDPNIEYPDYKNQDFVSAILELKLNPVVTRNNNLYFRVHCTKPDQWLHFTKRYLPEKPVNLCMENTYRITYTRSEIYTLATIMHNISKNKKLWSSYITMCNPYK